MRMERERERERERKKEGESSSPQVQGFQFQNGNSQYSEKATELHFIYFISFCKLFQNGPVRMNCGKKKAPGRSDIVGFTPINHLINQQ